MVGINAVLSLVSNSAVKGLIENETTGVDTTLLIAPVLRWEKLVNYLKYCKFAWPTYLSDKP